MESYHDRGFAILPSLLAADEVVLLRDGARELLRGDDSVMRKGDSDGRATLLKLWTRVGDDPFGLIARDERLLVVARRLLGEESVYCFSHKMAMKEPRQGGAWEWHQDYGYWYEYGCLAPSMLSIWIALDPATRANGCLQVLDGSHRLGRLEHRREDGQYTADGERVEQARRRCQHRYVELGPGDAVVFDCNLLHTSAANSSDQARWGFICSYNTVANAPYKQVRDYGHDVDAAPVPAGEALRRHGARA